LRSGWIGSSSHKSCALAGCETSAAAQSKFCRAVRTIIAQATGTTAIFTHGHVIALFLNALDSGVGRPEAEALTNPDVLRVVRKDGVLVWDREFRLTGLSAIATRHEETPEMR
jgi:broad specificity phosphatase PhoE